MKCGAGKALTQNKSINISQSEIKELKVGKKNTDFMKIDENDHVEDEQKIIKNIESKESFNPYENIEDTDLAINIDRRNNLSIDLKRQAEVSISGQSSTVNYSQYFPKLNTKPRSRMINYTYNNSLIMSTDNSKLVLDIRNKAKVIQKLNELNESLSPRFKLSRIDLEDIQNSSVIKAGGWNTQLTEDLLKSIKKQERRKLYYKNRVRQIAKRYRSKE